MSQKQTSYFSPKKQPDHAANIDVHQSELDISMRDTAPAFFRLPDMFILFSWSIHLVKFFKT